MPVSVINPKSKITPGYIYPPTGKVKIYVESSLPVDIFIANNEQADKITSAEIAAKFGVFGYLVHTLVDNQTVTLPSTWQTGWKLVIGNNNAVHVAVYHMVWNA
jgi:hypothetical protein